MRIRSANNRRRRKIRLAMPKHHETHKHLRWASWLDKPKPYNVWQMRMFGRAPGYDFSAEGMLVGHIAKVPCK